MTGTITLSNIQLRVEEFTLHQLPFSPKLLYIGMLYLDIPFITQFVGAGNFDIRLDDVLLVFSKNDNAENIDMQIMQKVLQMWISAFYFSLSTSELVSKALRNQAIDMDYSMKTLDKISLSFTNFHFRIEDNYESYLFTRQTGESGTCMSTGFVITKAEIRAPVSSDETDKFTILRSSTNKNIAVNKVVSLTFHVYCCRENSFNCSDVNKDNIRAYASGITGLRDSKDNLLNLSSIVMKVSTIYQKPLKLFGPVNCEISTNDLHINVSDDQASYLCHMISSLFRHFHHAQLYSRIQFINEIDNKSRRARARWAMIKDNLKVDWLKYASSLSDGTIRWRTWFEVWRQAGRYVAIRELIMYHVGFECTYDGDGEIIAYSLNESLLADHVRYGSRSNDEGKGKRYFGTGIFPPNILKAAEVLIQKNINHKNGEEEEIDPLSLSTLTIRALYAMQLELDTALPMTVTATCRLIAEEKYKLQRASYLAKNGEPDSDDENDSSTVDANSTHLLLAVIDATNLTGTFGSNKVDSYCSLHTVDWGNDGRNDVTRSFETGSASSKVHPLTGKGFVSWGDIFSMPTCSASGGGTDTLPGVLLECNSKGLFMPSYGRIFMPKELLLNFQGGEKLDGDMTISTHNFSLKPYSSSRTDKDYTAISTTNADTDAISIRIMTMIVPNSSMVQSARAKLTIRISEAIEERRQVLERQQAQQDREAACDEEDDVFVLDHSKLTVQDMKVNIVIPKLRVSVLSLYLNKETASITPITILLIDFNHLQSTITTSNNPWVVDGNCKFDCLRIKRIACDKDNGSKYKLVTVVKVPPVTLQVSALQTSSMSQYVDGSFDISAFDWSATLISPPFKLDIHPKSFVNPGRDESFVLWKAYRILSHLWMPEEKWSKGSLFNNFGEISYPKLNTEAALRLGSFYSTFPKHVNVLVGVSTWMKHIYEADASTDIDHNTIEVELEKQVTMLSMKTETRSMDIELKLPSPDADSDDPWLTDDDSIDELDNDNLIEAAKAVSNGNGNTTGSGVVNFLTDTTSVLTFGLVSGSKSANQDKITTPIGNIIPELVKENEKLRKKIKELESALLASK